jgi:hypothetical protein
VYNAVKALEVADKAGEAAVKAGDYTVRQERVKSLKTRHK